MNRTLWKHLILCSALGLTACDDGSKTSPVADAGSDTRSDADGGQTSDPQVPPTNGDVAAINAWIAAGSYKSWACEAQPHPQRPVSPHGTNRICSNAVLSAHGDGEYPVGSTGIKELFNDSNALVGHAVYVKVSAGTTGDAWYWYESISGSVVANGLGNAGVPKTVCVGCHMGAGSDSQHTGHDFVYTQVRPAS